MGEKCQRLGGPEIIFLKYWLWLFLNVHSYFIFVHLFGLLIFLMERKKQFSEASVWSSSCLTAAALSEWIIWSVWQIIGRSSKIGASSWVLLCFKMSTLAFQEPIIAVLILENVHVSDDASWCRLTWPLLCSCWERIRRQSTVLAKVDIFHGNNTGVFDPYSTDVYIAHPWPTVLITPTCVGAGAVNLCHVCFFILSFCCKTLKNPMTLTCFSFFKISTEVQCRHHYWLNVLCVHWWVFQVLAGICWKQAWHAACAGMDTIRVHREP